MFSALGRKFPWWFTFLRIEMQEICMTTCHQLAPSMSSRCLLLMLLYLFILSLLLLCLMPPYNARSIAASHREARKHSDIQVDPVEVASLAADPSFVLFNSHINHFDTRDDELRASAHVTNVFTQSSVFDVLPLSAKLDFQPAAQPQNETAFLQLKALTFTIAMICLGCS